jgi:hypothetical protein
MLTPQLDHDSPVRHLADSVSGGHQRLALTNEAPNVAFLVILRFSGSARIVSALLFFPGRGRSRAYAATVARATIRAI